MKKLFHLLPLYVIALFAAPFLLTASTSALKHEYQAIPAVSYRHVPGHSQDNFEIVSNDPIPQPLNRNIDRYLRLQYQDDLCKPYYFNNQQFSYMLNYVSGNNHAISTTGYTFNSYFTEAPSIGNDACFLNWRYNYSLRGFPGSLPFEKTPALSVNYTYDDFRFPYYSLYLSHSVKGSDGVVRDYNLSSSDLLNQGGFGTNTLNVIKSVNKMTIPLDNWRNEVGGHLTEGRHLEFTGRIVVDVDSYTDADYDLGSNSYARIRMSAQEDQRYATAINSVYNCTLTYTVTSESFYVDWSCPVDITTDLSDYEVVFFSLEFNAGNTDCTDQCSIFTTAASGKNLDWYFSGEYVITDYDDTPGDPISLPCFGEHCEQAPGAGDSESGDFNLIESLTSMFNFNFLNPFYPLFLLFHDNSSCINIPILADMVGAETNIYCPWFSADTRNILTPVVGLFSLMLVFGYAVRWLSDSSGNNTTDKTKGGK